MAEIEPVVGAVVEIPGARGVVRFYGPTEFSKTGNWVGIELTGPTGKNNGTVQGVSYFTCPPNHGIFVRAGMIKSITLPREIPRVTSPALNATAGSSTVRRNPPGPPVSTTNNVIVSRPAAGHKRTSSIGLNRNPSRRSPAPLSPATSRSVSPQKQNSSGKASPTGVASPRIKALNHASPVKRLSTSVRRPSDSRSASDAPQGLTSPVATTSRRPLEPRSSDLAVSPVPISPSPSQRTTSPPPDPSPPSVQIATVPMIRNGRQSALGHEITSIAEGELRRFRARVSELESNGKEDARIIESLRRQLEDASAFIKAKPIFQQKMSQLQQELIETKRKFADVQQLATINENRVSQEQDHLELAILDKEIAEERAREAESELEDLKEKIVSMEVELEMFREGGANFDPNSPAQSALAFAQLQRQYERLKEATMELREASESTEREQRERIAELEKELDGVEELHVEYEATLNNLSNAENHIDELKLQLDDALGAEDLVVELTGRNLTLGEKIEEMRIIIEDLEALKELNDELEENHVESERQLNEDIQKKEAELREQARQTSSLENICEDYENTISQFRELTFALQSEVESLRSQTQNAQDESANAVSHSSAMMSLNMKLQSTAAKNQARNIELELRKIEARESKELLAIVQPYLPQIYVDSDSDATNCYMFFQRMAAKADLINTVVAQVHGLPDALSDAVSEVIVGVCEMRGRISALSTLCKRFAAVMKRCNVAAFLNIGKIYPEISPLEKRLDLHIDLLRREEFRDMECVNDIVKIQAQFEHIGETYFDGFDHDLGERELGYALALDNDLDMFVASIGLTKTAVEAVAKDEDIYIDSGDDVSMDLLQPLQRLLDQCKGAKALSRKLVKRVEELVHDSTALKAQIVPQLRALNNRVPELVNFGIQLAQTVMPHLNDIRNNKQNLSTKAILNYMHPIVSSTVGKNESGDSSWSAVGDAITTLIIEAGLVVPTSMEAESTIKINAIAPWIHRVDEVKSALAVNVEAERKVAHLNEENRGLARNVKEREQTVQEANVKIELMERRLDAVKKQADAITELEGQIAKARKQERSYAEAIEQLQTDYDNMEQENSKLKALAAGQVKQAPTGTQVIESDPAALEGNLETSYLLDQIEAFRSTVRYLRRENSHLKGQDLLREIRSLPPIPDFSSRACTPDLVRSDSPGSDDSDSDERPRTPRTRQDLSTEANVLYREVLSFSSSPRVVDLSAINKRSIDAGKARGWMPKKLTPSHQLLERKLEGDELRRRVNGLIDRTKTLYSVH